MLTIPPLPAGPPFPPKVLLMANVAFVSPKLILPLLPPPPPTDWATTPIELSPEVKILPAKTSAVTAPPV